MDSDRNGPATVSVYGGVSFTSLLQIVFIVLKLCGIIDWHWALVMLPMIISVGLPLAIILISWVVYLIVYSIYPKNRS